MQKKSSSGKSKMIEKICINLHKKSKYVFSSIKCLKISLFIELNLLNKLNFLTGH